MTYQEQKRFLLTRKDARYALQDAINAFDAMDPMDASNDAQILALLMETRVNEVLGRNRRRTDGSIYPHASTDGLNEAGKRYLYGG